ncbi:MAG: hypothetical protein H6Q70_1968 [Firmicutes bacterium]|nr:hypothetical protein [Bacillota bacterium]
MIDLAVKKDVLDILDVFVIVNLSNIANNEQNVNVPLGFEDFINTQVVNNVNSIQIPSDLRNLLVNYILVNKINNSSSFTS